MRITGATALAVLLICSSALAAACAQAAESGVAGSAAMHAIPQGRTALERRLLAANQVATLRCAASDTLVLSCAV
jgi:hypothetical protein